MAAATPARRAASAVRASARDELERPARSSSASRPLSERPDAADDQVSADQLSLGAPPAPAADDHLARPAARPARPVRAGAARASTSTSCRPRSPSANPAAPARRVPRLLPRLPAPRAALGDPASAAPASGSGRATRPRSSSSRGSSTASCRPSSATSTGPTCSRSTARSRSAGRSGPSSSSGSSTCSRSSSSASLAGFVSFRTGLPPEVQFVFAIGVVVVVVLALGLLTMRNFGRRIITRLPLPHRVLELYDRFEEGVFSAIALRALPRPRRPHRPDLDDRGAAPLPRRPGARASRTSTSGISGAFFVALTGSLLTAVPLTPAGIGIVEAGVVGRADRSSTACRRPRRWRSSSSTARSASSRSSSSARSPTSSRRCARAAGSSRRALPQAEPTRLTRAEHRAGSPRTDPAGARRHRTEPPIAHGPAAPHRDAPHPTLPCRAPDVVTNRYERVIQEAALRRSIVAA